MSISAHRYGSRIAVIATVTTVAVVTVGFAAARSSDDTVPEDSGPTGSLLLDEHLGRTIDAGRQIVEALVGGGDEPAFLHADYGDCDAKSPDEAYAESYGRVDHADRGRSTIDHVEAGLDVLIELGWTPRDDDRWVDGIWERRSGWVVTGEQSDFTAFIYYYREDDSPVLVNVTGPCVEIADEQDDAFGRFEPLDIDLGASSTPPNTPTPETSTPGTTEPS